jgi:hypothetical protein
VPDLLRDDVAELLLIPPTVLPSKHLGESTRSSIPPTPPPVGSCKDCGRANPAPSELSLSRFWHSKKTDSTISKQPLALIDINITNMYSIRAYLLASKKMNRWLLELLPPARPSSRLLSPRRLLHDRVVTDGEKNVTTCVHWDLCGEHHAPDGAVPREARTLLLLMGRGSSAVEESTESGSDAPRGPAVTV